jgi:hypothetical protein
MSATRNKDKIYMISTIKKTANKVKPNTLYYIYIRTYFTILVSGAGIRTRQL